MLNKKAKRAASIMLAGAMVLSMAACGSEPEADPSPTPRPVNQDNTNPTDTPSTPSDDTNPGGEQNNPSNPSSSVSLNDDTSVAPSETTRTISVGTWFTHYYDSTHHDIYENPEVANPETAQMMLDNIRRIEDKYNVKIEFVNLTWDGTIESINNSIMAGSPDCDIYETDLQFGIPAALNGYAMALEDFVPADDDIFTDQIVFKYLTIEGIDKTYLFNGNAVNCGGFPLAFNMDMLDEVGLENPQDLYDRGEWTWDKFREYCRILTGDTDGDNNIDRWGFTSWFTDTLENLLMSNGAHIAGGKTESLSSPATVECFDFMYQLYQVDKTAKPWDPDNWDINVSCYTDGTVGFWGTAAWVQNNYGLSSATGFEIGIVPWPVGPSGNAETNNMVTTSGNWYIIPVGVERPELVYQVMKEYTNWYDGDLDYRDDTEWYENCMETERNFSYLKMMGERTPWFDLWRNVPDFNAPYAMISPVADQALTAAQATEQYKQIVQDFLDIYLNN